MNYIADWKRVEAILKRWGQLDKSREMLLRRTKIALKKYYWDKLTNDVSRGRLTKPLFDMAEYVYEAYNANLGKAKECLYAGTIFLDSILKETDRRFTSDVREANILSDLGKRLANLIWDGLEASKAEPPVHENVVRKVYENVVRKVYENVVRTLVDSLLEEQQ